MTTTEASPTTGRSRGVTAPGTRTFLLADAALTGGNGVAYLALMTVLDDLFGVSRTLLAVLGAFLIAVGVAVAYLATRRPIPRSGLRELGIVNLVWVAASIVFAIVADLTTAGVVWTLLQAAIVLGFAVRQLQLAAR